MIHHERVLLPVFVLLSACIPGQSFVLSMASMISKGEKPKLFDMPVSNHGARCRFIIYEKGIEDQIDIVKPSVIGGLKSEEYLALNCHGKVRLPVGPHGRTNAVCLGFNFTEAMTSVVFDKYVSPPRCRRRIALLGQMPLLVTEDCGAIPESKVISDYLVEKFQDKGASFRPATLAGRIKESSICRLHDTYMGPIQGCMYKAVPPFGVHSDRLAAIKDLETHLENMENLVSPEGPFLAGPEVSVADATVWPTMVFIRFMMPKFDKEESTYLGPKLSAWCKHMDQHAVAMRIMDEIKETLEGWDVKGRWNSIMYAGTRDTKPRTLFDKIIAKEIPSTVVFEDDRVMAFRDINPVAPTHILIVPKRRDGLTQLRFATADQTGVLGYMLQVAAKIANSEELEGFRLAINDGAKGGQEVFHLHMHLIDLSTTFTKQQVPTA